MERLIERAPYKYVVVDAYSVSLKRKGPRTGDARLSFYSAFILNAAIELYDAQAVENFVLFSDASFGKKKKSTGDLMKEALLKRGVPESNIVLFDELELNQTVTQVKKLKDFKDEMGISDPFLYVAWDNHGERVGNHLRGFQVPADVVSAVDVHQHFKPKFDRQKLFDVLPIKKLEKLEKGRRLISRFDTKGYIPRLLKPLLGGAYSIDNKRDEEGNLVRRKNGKLLLRYTPGKKILLENKS